MIIRRWLSRGRMFATGLDKQDRNLLIRAWWLLHLVRIGFRLMGFQRIRHLLVRKTPDVPNRDETSNLETARRAAVLVAVASKYSLGHPNCLARSLTSAILLSRMSISSDLRLGVKKTPNSPVFHAWVEVQGQVVNDDPEVASEYIAFAGDPDGRVFD
ncbi:MAG: lasso peptide biosynthesis B2 protein [Acidimicrobiia bacterium]|nr:lasso peptide biosynthesis B2 protein [Acidimicrobiia bacterium]NNC41774.1 lasso peptide biosynthesis B2 protein [Acidimicrobiia bacterium]NNL27612.1 lasso peptide biosynthesis B2 protein [Acidimicrobiia bacterium]